MLLLFDPEPPHLRWCVFEQGAARSGRCSFGTEWFRMVKEGAGSLGQVEAVGYLLRHGGDRIKEPVLRVTPQTLDQVEDAIRFLPEFNDITCKVLDRWTKELPAIPHFLFCDTAFFSGLPDVAGTYAVPEELREKGVRRFGSYGLVHQWAWDKTRSCFGENVGRMVSVYLGDYTNVAALRDGKSFDTTIGFTPVEGIPSQTGCGDIDATIVFELHSSGMSFREINELLSRKSGFSALLGRRSNYSDLASATGSVENTAARDILIYDILKYVGAFTATLGGLDTLAFATRHPEESMSLIREICGRLDFLPLKLEPAGLAAGAEAWKLSHNNSKINVSLLKSDIWQIMAHLIEPMIEENRP
jgi:acetate kinase